MTSTSTGEHPTAIGPLWGSALVFLSSACVLVLEIVAGRLLAPIIGESLETYTAVIGTVLAGIAAGNAIGGLLADRFDPTRILAPVLVLGGATAWLAPLVAGVFSEPIDPSPPAIVLLTALTFLAPPTVLGAVTPLVARLLIDDVGRVGRVIGNLSAVGTVGALVGTFGTGFVLVAHFPTRRIVVGVGAVLVVLGVATLLMLRPADRPNGAMRSVAVAALIGFGSVFAPDPCDTETPYVCVDLQYDDETPAGVALVLDGVRNSYIVPDDPTLLGFRYLRLFDDVADAHLADATAEPATVLHIGGAGFSFPSALRATRGDAVDQVVLEIDGGLVEVARDEFGVVIDDRLQVEVGDARQTIRRLDDDAFDLVVGDAFASYTVPWHLTTRQFVAEIDRVLADDGVLVMNLIDGGDLAYLRAQLATLAETFDHVALVAPPGDDSLEPGGPGRNQIVLASRAPLADIEVDPADGRFVGEVDTAELFDGAMILDDDFAPVDQLRHF